MNCLSLSKKAQAFFQYTVRETKASVHPTSFPGSLLLLPPGVRETLGMRLVSAYSQSLVNTFLMFIHAPKCLLVDLINDIMQVN